MSFVPAVLRRFCNRVRKWLAALEEKSRGLQAARESPTFAAQRICPFCRLITPRSEPSCMECGKPFKGIPLDRKPARQG